MKKKRISYFTLLEILIALSILAVAGSLVAYNLRRVYLEQQALNEMESVANVMKTASDLMMLVNLDSELKFSSKEGKLTVEFLPKSALSPLMKPLIPKKPLTLENIHTFSFEDGALHTHLTDQFSLLFLSKGFLMNRGVFTMESREVQGSLILLGYPSSLLLIRGDPPKYPDDRSLKEMILQITEETRRETEGTG